MGISSSAQIKPNDSGSNNVLIEANINNPYKNDKNEKSVSARILNKSDQKPKFILGIIDPQNDFFEGGSLAVSGANEILAPINKLRFRCFNTMETFISQDFHCDTHMSFNTTHNSQVFTTKLLDLTMEDGSIIQVNQQIWPPHCINYTKGSEFHKDLIITNSDKIFRKGTKKNVESYSAFGDEYGAKYENTGLNKWLKQRKVTDIILVGLATDYCVFNTAKDAIKNGYRVHLILSCVRGVEKNTTEKAITELINLGVNFYDDHVDFFHKKLLILN